MKDQIIVTIPSVVSAEGNGYNKLYAGGEFYEFHSWPYSELPPVVTQVRVSEYTYAAEATAEDGTKQIVFKKKEVQDVTQDRTPPQIDEPDNG
jgi:hypothetical protein